jgi:hypothetical protein
MSKRKPYEQHFKETFTKTLGQRYQESARVDKVAYWIFISIVFFMIAAGAVYSTF